MCISMSPQVERQGLALSEVGRRLVATTTAMDVAASDANTLETSLRLQVAAYVCTHVYSHVCSHLYTHIYTHVCARAYTHVCRL